MRLFSEFGGRLNLILVGRLHISCEVLIIDFVLARTDDLESAVFYSAWNQAIAKVMGRFSVDIYHVNDFHGAL
jgi:hypothetical protein